MVNAGLVSISFRKNTVDEIIAACQKAGLSGIEWGSDVHVPQGNVSLAEEVYKKTTEAGLSVFAYGSYFKPGEMTAEEFAPYLASAKALHAPLIRVWAGGKGTADADEAYRQKVIAITQEICDMAYPIKIVYEYHNGTLTDNYRDAVLCAKKVNRENFGLYWQPDYKKSFEENIEAIQAVKPYMSHVHTFFWKPDFAHKGYLEEGKDVLKSFINEAGSRCYLLEFVPDDDINNLKGEAETLMSLLKKKAIFLVNNSDNITKVYSDKNKEKLFSELDFHKEPISYDTLAENKAVTSEADYIFSTWSMPHLTKEEIKEYFPKAKAVFYGAGSVQGFAKEFLECGIRVCSAWVANGVPVAEYTVSQIVLANKGFFRSAMELKKTRNNDRYVTNALPGNYDVNVGLIGMGTIGSRVAKMLQSYNMNVYVFDIFLTEEKAKACGVIKADLPTIFEKCQTISNHLANNKDTVGMLNYDLFSKMKDNATFINTGRGAQVVEQDLIRALKEKPDRTAILDVTYPEPINEENEELYELENVILTPHIAGSLCNECYRMAEFMYAEFEKIEKNEPTEYEVTLEMLKTMA